MHLGPTSRRGARGVGCLRARHEHAYPWQSSRGVARVHRRIPPNSSPPKERLGKNPLWHEETLICWGGIMGHLLELLLHHALIAGPLCWSFCLGRLGGLSLRVCRFLLPWPWLAKDKVVLGDVSQQLGPSLFVLRCFFFLSVGLGLDMRWDGVTRSFGPIGIFLYILIGGEEFES